MPRHMSRAVPTTRIQREESYSTRQATAGFWSYRTYVDCPWRTVYANSAFLQCIYTKTVLAAAQRKNRSKMRADITTRMTARTPRTQVTCRLFWAMRAVKRLAQCFATASDCRKLSAKASFCTASPTISHHSPQGMQENALPAEEL